MSVSSLGMETAPVQERFEHLRRVITSQRFLKMQGIGNEVPFYICPYKPEEAVEMARMQKQLFNTVEKAGLRIQVINLYDLAMALLKQRGIFEKVLQIEPATEKTKLLKLLYSVLDPETHLVPAIGERIQGASLDVLFLTGVGQVFPYIRSHRILNNLQGTATGHPTLMFFPGAYTHSIEKGASLDLFGRLHDDKYYRAFNIYHCEV